VLLGDRLKGANTFKTRDLKDAIDAVNRLSTSRLELEWLVLSSVEDETMLDVPGKACNTSDKRIPPMD